MSEEMCDSERLGITEGVFLFVGRMWNLESEWSFLFGSSDGSEGASTLLRCGGGFPLVPRDL
jgi:hypothetical protein